MPYINEYTGQDGGKVSSLACRVYELELLGSVQQGQGAQGVPASQANTWAQMMQSQGRQVPQFAQGQPQGNWNIRLGWSENTLGRAGYCRLEFLGLTRWVSNTHCPPTL